jgi:hypothetical protein
VVQKNIQLGREERNLLLVRAIEQIKRDSASALHETTLFSANLSRLTIETDMVTASAQAKAEKAKREAILEQAKMDETHRDVIHAAGLERKRVQAELEAGLAERDQARQERLITMEAENFVKRLTSVNPHLIEAITTASRNDVIKSIAEVAAPRVLFGGESFVDVARKLFSGSPAMESAVEQAISFMGVGGGAGGGDKQIVTRK